MYGLPRGRYRRSSRESTVSVGFAYTDGCSCACAVQICVECGLGPSLAGDPAHGRAGGICVCVWVAVAGPRVTSPSAPTSHKGRSEKTRMIRFVPISAAIVPSPPRRGMAVRFRNAPWNAPSLRPAVRRPGVRRRESRAPSGAERLRSPDRERPSGSAGRASRSTPTRRPALGSN